MASDDSDCEENYGSAEFDSEDDCRSSYNYCHNDGSRCFSSIRQCSQIFNGLVSQRENNEFLDVVVEVEGRQFPCHRAVLATTPYFKAMFSSKLAESTSKVITLHKISAKIFSKILDFVYTEKIRIGKDDVQDILQAAHMLQFEEIMNFCSEFIRKNLCPSNCIGVMCLSDMYHDEYDFRQLKTKAEDMAVSHFLEARQSEEFLGLSTQQLLDLLKHKKLQITNEDDIVLSVLRWLDHDPDGRKAAVSTILPAIRLLYVRVSVLSKLLSHPVVQQSAECLAKIEEAKEEHLTGAQKVNASKLDQADSKPRHRTSDDLVIIAGGWKAKQRHSSTPAPPMPMQSIFCLDHDSDQCYHISDLPTPVCGYMSVTTSEERCLYVTGGRTAPLVGQGPHSAPSRQAFRYDFLTDSWTRLPDMPRGRAGHQSAVVNGKLFLVGGDTEATSDEAESVLSMDCFDLAEGPWIKSPTVPVLDSALDLVTSCKGKILLFEALYYTPFLSLKHPGFRGQMYTEQRKLHIHAFDVETERWTHSDLLIQHFGEVFILDVTGRDDKLYICSDRGCDVCTGKGRCFNLYAYDCKEETLSEVENEKDVTGSFLHMDCYRRYDDVQMDVKDVVLSDGYSCGMVRGRSKLALPSGLFGHSFLGTKKNSVGWYCRKMEKNDDQAEWFCWDRRPLRPNSCVC
ncbi:kelch-like protein 25 [Branchiostoma lanceolatum]|uniref:kelch-like protein 25 n=1 Tax=Branchiostoma lanceolatum TaxID=7740 RepID=UPI003453A678